MVVPAALSRLQVWLIVYADVWQLGPLGNGVRIAARTHGEGPCRLRTAVHEHRSDQCVLGYATQMQVVEECREVAGTAGACLRVVG